MKRERYVVFEVSTTHCSNYVGLGNSRSSIRAPSSQINLMDLLSIVIVDISCIPKGESFKVSKVAKRSTYNPKALLRRYCF